MAVPDVESVPGFPSLTWAAGLLTRATPLVPTMEAKALRDLLAVMARWEATLLPNVPEGSSGEQSVTAAYCAARDAVLALVPARLEAKLSAYGPVSVVEVMLDAAELRLPLGLALLSKVRPHPFRAVRGCEQACLSAIGM